jgi:RNA polymerase II-associated factor 1
MLVDSEMGMPLDLSVFDGVWEGDDSSLNRSEADIHPEDVPLLAPVSAKVEATGEVSWMRTSSLFMRKTQNKRRHEQLKWVAMMSC